MEGVWWSHKCTVAPDEWEKQKILLLRISTDGYKQEQQKKRSDGLTKKPGRAVACKVPTHILGSEGRWCFLSISLASIGSRFVGNIWPPIG